MFLAWVGMIWIAATLTVAWLPSVFEREPEVVEQCAGS